MPWQRLPDASSIDAGRSRFLIDENVDVRVVSYLKRQRYNVKTVAQAGLRHRDDQDVLAAAWREDRILITHDDDFLDESRYPPHRNPGVIILPGGSGDADTLDIALKIITSVVGTTREVWRGSTVRISNDFLISIRIKDYLTGARVTYKAMYDGQHAYEWVDDE